MAQAEAETNPVHGIYDRNQILGREDVKTIVECFKQNPVVYKTWERIHSAFGLPKAESDLWRKQHFMDVIDIHGLYTNVVMGWISATSEKTRTLGTLVDILNKLDLKLTAENIIEAFGQSNR